MLITNLYEQVLLEPSSDSNSLLIVSGYATASMADRHFAELDGDIGIKVIYGMAYTDGVSVVNDTMFKKLEDNKPFECYYFTDPYPVHSKVYIWMYNSIPRKAFVGSANYTQGGFLGEYQWKEAMAEVDPKKAYEYFTLILKGSMEIDHEDINEYVGLFMPLKKIDAESSDKVVLPLLTRDGKTGEASGLNWGQRPGRNPDQAYLRIPSDVAESGYFPPRSFRFTVRADDGFVFIATTAQDGSKAIHSPEGNHIIGQYFRQRIGVESGQFVKIEDLLKYGRTDVDFYKIDNETFYMDFSV